MPNYEFLSRQYDYSDGAHIGRLKITQGDRITEFDFKVKLPTDATDEAVVKYAMAEAGVPEIEE